MKPNNPSQLAAFYRTWSQKIPCPIIDLHGHWGPFGGSHLPCFQEELFVRTLVKRGIKQIVCSSHNALLADPLEGNKEMQEAIDRHCGVLLGYWAVNPNYPLLAKRAPTDIGKSRGFVGFKFLPDYHVYPLNGDMYKPSLEYADANKKIVLIHTWGGSAFNAPEQVAPLAEKYSKTIFIMGHSGYGQWEVSAKIANEYSNVYLDITAVYAAHDFAMQPTGSGTPMALLSCLQVNGIIEFMTEKAGSDKIVFGTDMPWYSPSYALGSILFAKIDEDARRNILYRNAERILNICRKE